MYFFFIFFNKSGIMIPIIKTGTDFEWAYLSPCLHYTCDTDLHLTCDKCGYKSNVEEIVKFYPAKQNDEYIIKKATELLNIIDAKMTTLVNIRNILDDILKTTDEPRSILDYLSNASSEVSARSLNKNRIITNLVNDAYQKLNVFADVSNTVKHLLNLVVKSTIHVDMRFIQTVQRTVITAVVNFVELSKKITD